MHFVVWTGIWEPEWRWVCNVGVPKQKPSGWWFGFCVGMNTSAAMISTPMRRKDVVMNFIAWNPCIDENHFPQYLSSVSSSVPRKWGKLSIRRLVVSADGIIVNYWDSLAVGQVTMSIPWRIPHHSVLVCLLIILRPKLAVTSNQFTLCGTNVSNTLVWWIAPELVWKPGLMRSSLVSIDLLVSWRHTSTANLMFYLFVNSWRHAPIFEGDRSYVLWSKWNSRSPGLSLSSY